MPVPPQQTLDQRRAKHAMQVVAHVMGKYPRKPEGGKPDPKAEKFDTHARKLPVRIIASGLGQALVFVKVKGTKADGPPPELLVGIADWVLNKPTAGFNPAGRLPPDDALLKAVVEGSSDYLRQATGEALAYLRWLTRFCEANKLTDEADAP